MHTKVCFDQIWSVDHLVNLVTFHYWSFICFHKIYYRVATLGFMPKQCPIIWQLILKVSKSQKHFFFKFHCPKNERNTWQNSALASYGRILSNISFFGQWSFKKNDFEIYSPLGRHQKKVSMLTPGIDKIGQA